MTDNLWDTMIPPRDPTVRTDDKPRLSRQCLAILAMLRTGKKANYELARVALKYTSRISDLRHAGYDIRCHDQAGGIAYYELVSEPGKSVAEATD